MAHLRRRPKQLIVQERCIYHAELELCPACGTPLYLSGHYSWRKTVQHLDKVVYVASRPKECRDPSCRLCGKRYPAAGAQGVALPHSTYGLDVVAQIGWGRDREHLSGDEIHQRLKSRVQISRRHVDLLLQQYRLLLACAQHPQLEKLAQTVVEYGGLIISLDGLEPEGAQEQLWVVREVLTDTTLAAGWLPRVNAETLRELLAPVKAFLERHGWPVLATLSDKQGPLVGALEATWPGVPHQWCQAHYLGNVAQPLYEQDQALKTDLRQDVRKAIRRSLKEVAAEVPGGAFSPQVATGLVVTEVPPTAQASPPPSTAETPKVIEKEVVQGYARVLQEGLGRKGRAPFVLGGVALFDDLQAVQGSLARCLAWREEPHLRHWHDVLTRLLPTYADGFAEVRLGQEWVNTVRRILDEAPLPTREGPGPGSDEVARQLAHALGHLADQRDLSPWLSTFRQHLFAVNESYWSGLFACYDIVGLPRTTNDLEGLFGRTKRHIRRQTGLSQLRQPLQRQGAWLIYQSRDETAADLYRRLAQVPVEAYRAERARFESRQERFRYRYHWRHDRAAVLARLESHWASAGPDSS